MKKTLLIVSALLLSVFAFAQQQLATLNHNGNIRVFYGQSALQNAHGAAVNGDIITLSPGTFNSVNITKAITIRGAGMFSDTVAGTEPTTLINNYNIIVNNDSVYSLYMEGIYHACDVVYAHRIYNPQFVKCYFKRFEGGNRTNNCVMVGAMFINCILNRFSPSATDPGQNGYTYTSDPQFLNSVILDLITSSSCYYTLINCVAKYNNDAGYLNTSTVSNSILYYERSGWTDPNAYSSYYSIGVNLKTNVEASYFNTSGISGHHIYSYKGLNTVFKNFTGSYSPGITFELLDNVAATCLGDDGTQVGIYGGIMPFDPKVRNPLIKKCNVARRSTIDGKLAVDIEVVSE